MSTADFSPAAERNKQVILDTLRQVLPERGSALEIASGTGQHIACFAQALPHWLWQPSDVQSGGFASIAAWVAKDQLNNVQVPLPLDVLSTPWQLGDARFDAIYCANMLHISPWTTCAALMHGSAEHLSPKGVLITYGPYLEDDVPTSQGNLIFDQSLRQQNPAWGIRRREDVEQEAARAGLHLSQRHALPANNLLLVWTRAA
ncbi:hypothetical protein AwPolaro_11060 [Polaromonas sp.]|nr:hypothetical protein AwPolaro_11060 [Polaromonas sp.]